MTRKSKNGQGFLGAGYCVVAIINACRYCLETTILMAVVSAVYVFLFFKFMKLKR